MARRAEAGGQPLPGAREFIRNHRPVIDPSLVSMLDRRLFSGESRQQLIPQESAQMPSDLLEIEIDVEHYNETELTVKVINRNLIVSGRHNQRLEREPHECIASRAFSSSYKLPDNVDVDLITCDMSSDNYLYISAPRATKHRAVPIRMTGVKRLRRSDSTHSRSNVAESMANSTESQDIARTSAQVPKRMDRDGSMTSADATPRSSDENTDTTALPVSGESTDILPLASGDGEEPNGACADAAPQGEGSADAEPRVCDANADIGPAVSSTDISSPM